MAFFIDNGKAIINSFFNLAKKKKNNYFEIKNLDFFSLCHFRLPIRSSCLADFREHIY